MPLATTRVTIDQVDVGRTRMSIESSFPSAEAMEWILTTGTDEGRTLAVGQIDAILAEVFKRPSPGTETELVEPTA